MIEADLNICFVLLLIYMDLNQLEMPAFGAQMSASSQVEDVPQEPQGPAFECPCKTKFVLKEQLQEDFEAHLEVCEKKREGENYLLLFKAIKGITTNADASCERNMEVCAMFFNMKLESCKKEQNAALEREKKV